MNNKIEFIVTKVMEELKPYDCVLKEIYSNVLDLIDDLEKIVKLLIEGEHENDIVYKAKTMFIIMNDL